MQLGAETRSMEPPTIQPKDASEWRDWLSHNYDKAGEIWILFYRKAFNKQGLSMKEAVDEALCFGWIDGKLKKFDAERFVLRFSPRKPLSVWSKINRDRAEQLIEDGKMAPPGFAAIAQAKKSGNWDKAYTNRVRDPLPADLESGLRQSKEAWLNFQKLANSYWNQYIGWVNAAKTEKTRIQRIGLVIDRALQNKKPMGTEG